MHHQRRHPRTAGGRSARALGAWLALALAAPAATAQLPRLVDCGDLNGYATGEPGYELLEEAAGPADISLTPPALDTVHVAGNFENVFGGLPLRSDVLCVDPDRLDRAHLFTSLQLADGTVLGIDGLAPSTAYRMRLELGALAPWGDLTSFASAPYWTYSLSISRGVRVELPDGAGGWRTVASDIRCTSAHSGATFSTFVGGVVPLWVLARTDATGRLEVRLSTDGADPLFLTGFELHDHEDLPVVYQRSGGSPLVGATPGTAAFVAAFNAGDFDLAESTALAMPDDFERGVALAHLVGWLDGSRHGRLHLLDDARQALLAAGTAHPAAAWLVDELDSLERALDHLDAKGYRSAFACEEDGGKGFLNTDCGGQYKSVPGLLVTNANAQIALRELRGITARIGGDTVLDALVDWNAGAIPAGDWEPSPLVFAALKLTGTTMVDMNPLVQTSGGDADAAAFRQLRRDILEDLVDLGFAATDFPRDYELLLYREYMVQDKFPKQWTPATVAGVLSSAQIADSWWGDLVALPAADPSAPVWANRQREQLHLSRALLGYWLGERLVEGELGGGLGDDIELLGQFARMMSSRMDQTDQRAADAVDAMVTHVLEESGDVVGGYFAGGLTDVEHAAEYTTNTFFAHRSVFGHTARTADVALGVAERLLYAQDPSLAFAAPTNLGRVHMRSFNYTAAEVDPSPANAIDILLNGRSMYPAVGAGHHAPLTDAHPLVADLLAWADGWRDDADDTTGGKPAGWYGPVQWPSNDFGVGGLWWNASGSTGDDTELSGGVHTYTLDLLRMAYHRSSAADRWRYLVPVARMFRSVIAWEDAGQPASPPQGGAQWAAKTLKESPRFGILVLDHLADLRDDPDLTTLVDPAGTGHAYVDATLVARMEAWVRDEFNGQTSTVKYALGPTVPCTGGTTAKSPLTFLGAYEKVVSYYRSLFPLLTTHVIHTDRVGMDFSGGGAPILQSSVSGEEFVEGLSYQPLVRWRSRLDDGQDLAVQCNFRDFDAGTYSAFVHNFESGTVTSTLFLDEGLVPGEYLVEHGAALETCDEFPLGGSVSSFTVQKRGRGVPVDVPFEPGLNLVRLSRQGPPDALASAYDLAVDPPFVERLVGAGGLEGFRIRARVNNLGAAASPAAVLRVKVAVMEEDGALVALPGAPAELTVHTEAVPSLPASTGWTAAEWTVTVDLPVDVLAADGRRPAGGGPGRAGSKAAPAGPPGPAAGAPGTAPLPVPGSLGPITALGRGLQVRVEVVGDGLDHDLLNDAATRGWTVTEMSLSGR